MVEQVWSGKSRRCQAASSNSNERRAVVSSDLDPPPHCSSQVKTIPLLSHMDDLTHGIKRLCIPSLLRFSLVVLIHESSCYRAGMILLRVRGQLSVPPCTNGVMMVVKPSVVEIA
jgi:hypothetical protein